MKSRDCKGSGVQTKRCFFKGGLGADLLTANQPTNTNQTINNTQPTSQPLAGMPSMPQSPQALFRKAQALEGPLSSEDLATNVKEPMEIFCVLFGSYIILKLLHLILYV